MTGNIALAALITALVQKNIPVVSVVIGDSSNGLSAINTLNTLATLSGIARKHSKALSVIYINNHLMATEGKGLTAAQDKANHKLFSIISLLSLFLSGQNEALDNQDMMNILEQTNYKTINLEPGLYGLTFHSKTVNSVEHAIPTTARTIMLPGKDSDIGVTLLHHKVGITDNPNVIKVCKEETFPIHMVSSSNFFHLEEKNLKNITDEYYEIQNSIKMQHTSGTSNSKLDDDLGIVF